MRNIVGDCIKTVYRGRSSPATSGRTCGTRIVEALANERYTMELENAPGWRG